MQFDINKNVEAKGSPRKFGMGMGFLKGFALNKVEEEKKRQEELERELAA